MSELDKKKSYNIGVMIGNVHTGHPRELIHGVRQGAKDCNVNATFFLTTQSSTFFEKDDIFSDKPDYDYQLNTIYDYSLLAGLDALIISYGTVSDFLPENEKEQFLGRYKNIPSIILESLRGENNIISDNYQGIKEIMEHLLKEHGFKKIGFIGGPDGNLDGEQRRAAYIDTMTEHSLQVTETMIVYGNYSQLSGEKATDVLLSNHPDLEAIVCANDEMAMGAYKACERNGKTVGRDIAVTGYDNMELAKSIDPPLTTADQNGYDMGYRAMMAAIKLCEGEKIDTIKLPSKFMKRKSCGCDGQGENIYENYAGNQDILSDIEFVSGRITSKCILNSENKKLVRYIRTHVEEFVVYLVVVSKELGGRDFVDVDKNYVAKLIRKIIDGKYENLVSSSSFLEEINHLFEEVIAREESSRNKLQLTKLLIYIQEYVYSLRYYKREEGYSRFKQRAWIGPVFEKSLMGSIEDEKQVFHDAMVQLHTIGIKTAFIFVFDKPIVLRPEETWVCPEQIYLASRCLDGEITSYEIEKRPIITKEDGFTRFYAHKNGCSISAFTLYSEETQFGMLLCELDDGIISSIHTTSLQLGNVLGFMELTKKEKEARAKLGDSLRLLQEKNEVLNFISETDLMTGLLNRRGFGESALKLNRKNAGKKAYFVFADLDHLKEINDTFGHSEGDFAIIEGAQILNTQVGKNGIAGRLGGDEFTLMIVTDEENFTEDFLKRVKSSFQLLNDISQKPFYVECSLGIREFVCGEDFKLNELLTKADERLYESKKMRKKTICREVC